MDDLVELTTVYDEGALELARGALADAGIQVQVRRVQGGSELSLVRTEGFALLVPKERHADATAILDQLEKEAEAGLTEQAMAQPPPADARRRLPFPLLLAGLLVVIGLILILTKR